MLLYNGWSKPRLDDYIAMYTCVAKGLKRPPNRPMANRLFGLIYVFVQVHMSHKQILTVTDHKVTPLCMLVWSTHTWNIANMKNGPES
jgi:hypothetical protein